MDMNIDVLNGDIEMLYQFLSSSMDAFDYEKSKYYASYCELAICENMSLPQDSDIVLKFYAYQMVNL